MDDLSGLYAALVAKVNAGPHERAPGACTPPVVDAYNATSDDGKRIINAITAVELKRERRIRLDDEAEVLAKWAELRARSEAAKAKAP